MFHWLGGMPPPTTPWLYMRWTGGRRPNAWTGGRRPNAIPRPPRIPPTTGLLADNSPIICDTTTQTNFPPEQRIGLSEPEYPHPRLRETALRLVGVVPVFGNQVCCQEGTECSDQHMLGEIVRYIDSHHHIRIVLLQHLVYMERAHIVVYMFRICADR